MLTDLQKAKLHKHLLTCFSALGKDGHPYYDKLEELDKEKLKGSYLHFIGRIEMGMEIGVEEVMAFHEFIVSVVDSKAYAASGIRVALEQSEGLKLIPAIYIRLRSKLGPNDDITRKLLDAHFWESLNKSMTVQEEADKLVKSLPELRDLLDEHEKLAIKNALAPLKISIFESNSSISTDPLA